MSRSTSPSAGVTLTEPQLAAALALARVRIGPGSPLANLTLPAQPLPILSGTSVLDKSGQSLLPLVVDALQLAGSPNRILEALVATAGQPVIRRVVVCEGQASSTAASFIAVEKQPTQGYTLLPLRTLKDAAAYIGQLLQVADSPAPSKLPESTLTLAAYAALLAGADAVQASRLRLRLSRSNSLKPVLTADILGKNLRDGLVHSDSRWAVSASRSVCPADLELVKDQLDAGLIQLQRAGMVRPVQRGYGFTAEGEPVVDTLAGLTRIAHLTLTLPSGNPRRPAAQASVFIGISDTWIAKWTSLTERDASLRLTRLGAAEASDYVRTLFELKEAPAPVAAAASIPVESPTQHCPKCHAAIAVGARFCSDCGSDLSAKPPPQPRCPNPRCGQAVSPGKKFCTACGTRVVAQEAAG